MLVHKRQRLKAKIATKANAHFKDFSVLVLLWPDYSARAQAFKKVKECFNNLNSMQTAAVADKTAKDSTSRAHIVSYHTLLTSIVTLVSYCNATWQCLTDLSKTRLSRLDVFRSTHLAQNNKRKLEKEFEWLQRYGIQSFIKMHPLTVNTCRIWKTHVTSCSHRYAHIHGWAEGTVHCVRRIWYKCILPTKVGFFKKGHDRVCA